MITIKLYYTDDGRLLYSRNWPEIPEVEMSIYKEIAVMAKFKREIEYLTDPRRAIEVINVGEVINKLGPVTPGNFYELEVGGYTIDAKLQTISIHEL